MPTQPSMGLPGVKGTTDPFRQHEKEAGMPVNLKSNQVTKRTYDAGPNYTQDYRHETLNRQQKIARQGAPSFWDDFNAGRYGSSDPMASISHGQAKKAQQQIGRTAYGARAMQEHFHQPDKSAYDVQQGVGDYWAEQANQARGLSGYGALGDQARQGQLSALDMLMGRAQGQDSIVAQQAALERSNLQNALASQAASQRGGYNPAAIRGAQIATGQGLAQLGAQSAIGQSQERLGALNAFLGGSQQMRGQDLQSGLAATQAAQQALGMGMQDKYQQAASRQAYEQMMANLSRQDFQTAGQFVGAMKQPGVQYNQGQGGLFGMIGSGINAAGNLLGSIFS